MSSKLNFEIYYLYSNRNYSTTTNSGSLRLAFFVNEHDSNNELNLNIGLQTMTLFNSVCRLIYKVCKHKYNIAI